MTQAGFAQIHERNSTAETVLGASVKTWFLALVVGQGVFPFYLVSFYRGSTALAGPLAVRERFQQKWIRFRGSKTRQSKNLEPFHDSEKRETAPERYLHLRAKDADARVQFVTAGDDRPLGGCGIGKQTP